MSDFILEILEPVANTIEIETSILDTVTDNIIIEYQNNNTIDIETSISDTVTDNITIEYQNNNTIEIETSILDSVTENVTIEYEYNNTIDIINTEKILASDIPYGYDINNTTGNLPYSRVENLETYIQSFIPQQSSVAIDGGSP